ncbi:reverse transcriptase [Phytophthora cinnamomi]|uniref:reverse transcriptase n=1 Tax=Phytophthora cinnamomi TaxID=4785 RepID=UPI003559C71F|nr:reverse transcriptase [Phytophthora cinnamomi]
MRGSANEWRRAGLHDEAPCDQAGLDIARPQTGSAGEETHYRAAGLHEGKCCQAGLDTARPRTGSAGEQLSTAGPGPEEQLCGAGLRTTRRRRKRRTLRKSRSVTETQQEQSAGQTGAVTPDVETLSILTRTDTGFQYREMELASPPTTASELTSLPAMSWKRFTRDLHDGRIEQVCVLSDSKRTESESEELRQLFMGSTNESEDTLSAKTKRERFEEQGWDSLKSSPYYELLREYKDVLPEEIPAELPQDKDIQHEIDLVPGTKYCHAAVATAARAMSTPSGMLWEWLVMPQGLKNAPATFNRCVTHLLRSVRDFAPSYFDDVFIHSQDVDGKTDVEIHRVHLRKLLELMRKHKLYANLKKCIFGASDIPVLGRLVGKNGVRPDPEKVRVINEWPTPSSVKELRQFLGLATYLCKYVEDYAPAVTAS